LAGAKLPGKVDGSSMVGVIRDGEAKSAYGAFHWAMGKQWAVREGDWKLLGNPVDESKKAAITKADELFLVNLAEDVGEMKNVAKDHPEIVDRLKGLHEAWVKDVAGK
jgi:arylsulfatase A